jgi:hypothetical protein
MVMEFTITKILKKPTMEIFQREKKMVMELIRTLSETFTKVISKTEKNTVTQSLNTPLVANTKVLGRKTKQTVSG